MLLPPSLPLAHPACGCGSSARSRTRQHKPVTRAGLQFFTLTLARSCLRKQGCECLSPDGAKYFYTSLPQSLSLCITARKRYGRKIRAARRRREQVTPNLQLYFQASQLNYSANWAPRKTSTSSHQIWEHGTDELRSAAACVADVAALCRGSQLSWGSPCVSVFRVSWLFLGVPSPGSRPRCRGGVGVSPCWDSVSVAKNGSVQEDTAGHAPSPRHPQNVRVKVLAGLGVFSTAVICFVLKQVNPYGNALWCLCAPYCISHANTAAKPT